MIALLALQSCATIDHQRTTRSHAKKTTPKATTNIKTGVYKTDVTATYYHDKFNGKKQPAVPYLVIVSSLQHTPLCLLAPN